MGHQFSRFWERYDTWYGSFAGKCFECTPANRLRLERSLRMHERAVREYRRLWTAFRSTNPPFDIPRTKHSAQRMASKCKFEVSVRCAFIRDIRCTLADWPLEVK